MNQTVAPNLAANLGAVPITNLTMGNIQIPNLPMGNLSMANLNVGLGNLPVGGLGLGNLPVGGIGLGNLPVGGLGVGNLGVQMRNVSVPNLGMQLLPMVQPAVNYVMMLPQAGGLPFAIPGGRGPSVMEVAGPNGDKIKMRLRADGTYSKSRHFSPEEDERLIELVDQHPGTLRLQDWDAIAAQHASGFTGRQCRDRWHNYLRPPLDRDPMSPEEKRALVRAAVENHNNWAHIASLNIGGKTRSCAMIKNTCLAMLDKLDRIGIPLQTVRHVDALPIEAFEGGTFRTNMKAKAIREHYFNSIDEPAPKTDDDESD